MPFTESQQYTKLDLDLKEKWVRALRSDDYTQGTGALRTKQNRFCCLGVLCDVVAQYNNDLSWVQGAVGGEGDFTLLVYDDHGNMVESSSGSVPQSAIALDEDAQQRLIMMNDRDFKSYSEIADWIDENL